MFARQHGRYPLLVPLNDILADITQAHQEHGLSKQLQGCETVKIVLHKSTENRELSGTNVYIRD